MVHCLRLLDFGDHRRPAAFLIHDLVDTLDIDGVADKRQCDKIHATADRPAQIVLVFIAQCRHVDGHTGKIDSLVVGNCSGDLDFGDDPGSLNGNGAKADLAVIDQDRVPGLDILGQALEGCRANPGRALDVLGRDHEPVSDGQSVRTVGEPSKADLRSLQVGHDANSLAEVVRGLADVLIRAVVNRVVPVAHIHAGNVDPCFEYRQGVLITGNSRTECSNNFCASHIPSLVVIC